jgi:hypothetical protein
LRDLVISRFDDGNLISKFGTATFVKFNVGTTHVFASTSEDTEPALKLLDWTQANKWPYKTT